MRIEKIKKGDDISRMLKDHTFTTTKAPSAGIVITLGVFTAFVTWKDLLAIKTSRGRTFDIT